MTAAERMETVAKLRPQLVRFARMRLRNPAHAEDAVQETLLAAIERIDSFSGVSSLFSWLTGILKHKIVDCIRRSARDQCQEMDNDGTPLGSGAPHFSGFDEPDVALQRRRRMEALERCVQQLPARTAETFFLRDVMGFNTAETCRVLAVSDANCAVMLHRARARIRAEIAPELMDS